MKLLRKVWLYVRPLRAGEPVAVSRIYIAILQVVILVEIIKWLIGEV